MIDQAIDDIDNADIKPLAYRAAIRLLRASNHETGMIWMTMEEAMDICLVNSVGSLRRLLGKLQQAGIIHYTTNGTVYVMFKAWSPDSTKRAPTRERRESNLTFRADDDPEDGPENDANSKSENRRAKSENTRAKSENRRAKSENGGHTSLLVSSSISSDPETNELTSAPKRRNETRPQSEEEYFRSVALLTDPEAGIDRETAEMMARAHRFDWLLMQVLAYRRDLARGQVDGTGALIWRINKRFGATIKPADRETELYKRHMRPVDEVEERRRKYLPDEYAGIIIG